MAARRVDGFEPWASAWLGSFSSTNTRSAYARDLEVFRRWLATVGVRPRQVAEPDVEAFAGHCSSMGAADATVRRRVAAVSSFYRYVADDWSMANPVAASARPAVDAGMPPVALSAADADTFWRAALSLGPKTAALVGLVLHDGMKAHEVLRLEAGDVRPSGRSVVLRGGVGGDATPRVLDPRTASALRHYLGSRREGPLLCGDSPTRPSARLTRHGVDYLIRRTAGLAGLDTPVTVNVLRNTQAARQGRSDVRLRDDGRQERDGNAADR